MSRTVTIPTRDHGDVTVACPDWCTGQYHQAGGYRVDITHTSPETELTVPTATGPAVLLRFDIELRPFTESAPGRVVFASVEIDGDRYACDPDQVDALARGLVENATQLRSFARRLAVLKETGR
ncbi:DUF6907 domain-containing protein [Streptomyces sp. NPDC059544]|uniref:DUF6907 domain-containing protein n=1 Tax=Streptomyces sp. NPDC059544 TaxID=3346861 RepID=UPI00368A0E8E